MAILSVRRLHKRFKGISALEDVSLEVSEGEVMGIIGPNGAGKTTLLNVINGYLRPDRGEVIFDGGRIDGLQPYRIARLGVSRAFQVVKLFRRMTVIENMLIPMLALNHGRAESIKAAYEMLREIGLEEKSESGAGELSGGQQKLLEFGRALLVNPKLVLLDEPFAGVSPVLKQRMIDVIRRRVKEGTSFIIVSHDIPAVVEACERVVAMHQGMIIADGKPVEVSASSRVVESYLGV